MALVYTTNAIEYFVFYLLEFGKRCIRSLANLGCKFVAFAGSAGGETVALFFADLEYAAIQRHIVLT